MQRHYKFTLEEFNSNGFKTDGTFFIDFVRDCENDFRNRFPQCFPNYLTGNNSTMHLLKCCQESEINSDWGMERAEDDRNSKLDNNSVRDRVCAINSAEDLDVPMYLVLDKEMNDGIISLKYLPDSDVQ